MNTAKIFLSYSHKNKALADKIFDDLTAVGIHLTRDVKDLKYRESISQFMNKISKHDYVILLISDPYLKSVYCMYEVLELLKTDNYRDRILPVIIDETVYNRDSILSYVEYWENKYEQLDKKLDQYRRIDVTSTVSELKVIDKIRSSINDFLFAINDLKNISFEGLLANNYTDITNLIGFTRSDPLNSVIAIISKNPKAHPDELEIELDTLLLSAPANKEALMLKSTIEYYTGHAIKAKHHLEEVIEKHPDCWQAYNCLALILQNEFKDYESARQLFIKGIEINSQDSTAHKNLALILADHDNDFDGAKSHLLQALELNPEDPEICYELGQLFQKKFKDYLKAKIYYSAALELDPGLFQASICLADIFTDVNKDYDMAEALLLKAIEASPRESETFYQYGNFLFECRNDWDGAQVQYEKCLEINPKNHKALYNLAVILSEHGDHEKAKGYLKQVIELNPGDVFSYFTLAYLLERKLKDVDGAESYYSQALKIGTDKMVYKSIASLYTETYKDYKRAAQIYLKIIDLDPMDADAYCDLGLLYLDHWGDNSKAKECFLQSIEINPSNAISHKNLAVILASNDKDYEEARNHFQKALVIDPNDAEAHYKLGTILTLYLKDKKGAQVHFNKALSIDHDLLDIFSDLLEKKE